MTPTRDTDHLGGSAVSIDDPRVDDPRLDDDRDIDPDALADLKANGGDGDND